MFGVERDDLMKRRAGIQHVVDHDRRRLESAGPHVVLGHRPVDGLPGPRQLEIAGVAGGDVRGRRVLAVPGVAAVVRPLDDLFARPARPRKTAPSATMASTRAVLHISLPDRMKLTPLAALVKRFPLPGTLTEAWFGFTTRCAPEGT